MADFQDEASASLDQGNPERTNTELDQPYLDPEEPSFTKQSDPNMDPLNPFSTQHPSLASLENIHFDQGEEPLIHYHGESHAEPGVVYSHDDPGDLTHDDPGNMTHEETRNNIFLDSDQHGDGPFSSPSHIGRGDEVDEIVQENNDSNPFSMEVENPNITSSSGQSVVVSRPGVGYNPFLIDEQEGEMDEEDDRTDDSQDHSDGFPDPGLNGSLGSVGRGDERGVNHTYNLLEEDEEEEVDIQMEPVENIQYAQEEEEEEHRAPVANEAQVLNDYRFIGDLEDVSHGPRYAEDLSHASDAQQAREIIDLTSSEHHEDVLERSSRGEAEDGARQTSTEHVDDAFHESLLVDDLETSLADEPGHVGETSMTSLPGNTEDVLMTASFEHVKDLPHMKPAELAEDMSQITEHEDEVSMAASVGRTEDISQTTSAGHEDENVFQPPMKEDFHDVDQLAPTLIVEDKPQVPSTVHDTDMSSFMGETETFPQMPSEVDFKETSELFKTELDDYTPENVSPGVAAETTSCLLKEDDYSLSLGLPGKMPECPTAGYPEDSSMFSSEKYVDVSQISCGFTTEMPECALAKEHDDTSEFPEGKDVADISHVATGSHVADISHVPTGSHVADISHVPTGSHVADISHVPIGSVGDDNSQFSSEGHAEDMFHASVARDVENTQPPSGQFNQDTTHIPSMGHTEEEYEMSLGRHSEEVFNIPSVEHAEYMSMTSDLKDMTPSPSKTLEEDTSSPSLTKDVEGIELSLSPRYPDDLSDVTSADETVTSSQVPPSLADESIFSEDTSAACYHDSVADKRNIAANDTVHENSTQEDFQIRKDLESYDYKDVQVDGIDSSKDTRYEERNDGDGDMDTSTSIADGFRGVGSHYLHDMIAGEEAADEGEEEGEEDEADNVHLKEEMQVGPDDSQDMVVGQEEEEEDQDEADNVKLKEEIKGGPDNSHDVIVGEEEEEENEEEGQEEGNVMLKEKMQAESEGHMLDVSGSQLEVSDPSCGYVVKHDHEKNEDAQEKFVERDNIARFDEPKGVESCGDDMFIDNSNGIGQEKQMGENEERQGQKEHDLDKIQDFGIQGEKGFSSRFDSDVMSSEYEDRSYVDNLSELASPDIIPQPLPSPPEPKDLSPFDPMAPSDTPSPCHEHNGEIGQHGEQFESASVVIPEENGASDFLTSVEVDGETKFGVDGTAITSTGENHAFLHSDEEDDDEDGSQNLDQGGFTTTGTTETETSIDDRSGDSSHQTFEQTETNDNALMSMSMEGSFYDDGGELMGGDDRRNQQQNLLYEDGYITEESSQQDSYEPKQEHFVVNPDEFGQKVLSVLVQENHQVPQSDSRAIQEKEEDFDPLHGSGVPSGSAVVSVVCGGSGHVGDFDSLIDVSVNAQSVQGSNAEQREEVVDSLEKHEDVAHKSESLVESRRREEHEAIECITSQGVSDTTKEKIEKSTEDATHTDKEKQTTTVSDAAATTAVSVTAAGTAGDEAVSKTVTAVKKSTAKPAGKTTTPTTTKAPKETKVTNGKAATTTTTSKPSPKKQAEPRPTSVTTAERKTSSKTAGSPTESATPPVTKPTAPLPSYAQPIPHRKPREAKIISPEEKRRKVAAATGVPRASSAAPHPRPQSVSGSTATTLARSTARSASTVASRTAQLARPKSSPTKMTNGLASPSTDGVRSPTTKHETDSKKEEHRPRSSRKEHKTTSKVDSGIKTATTPTSVAAKSPTKQASPLSLASPRTGEIKSKIGSLENATHTPGGGHVKIINKKPKYSNVSSKIGSKDNMDYKPGGGNVKIENRKIKVEAKSKVGSLENATHKPGGGDKKIEVQKTEWKAQSKIGSLDNAKHKPGVGEKQTNGSDGEEKMLKNGLAENTGPAGVSEHTATELLNGSASEI